MLSEFSPLSVQDVMRLNGVSKQAAAYRLKRLWDRKILYIASWQRGVGRGAPSPAFAIGGLPDAVRPQPLTQKEMKAKWLLKPESKAIIARQSAKSNARNVERRKKDPAFAEATRKAQREWLRKKHGYQPIDFRRTKFLDEIAMQFGITWRFEKTQRRAA